MPDTFLRERPDVIVSQPPQDTQVYTDWVMDVAAEAPEVTSVKTGEDGSVTIADTRPEPSQVETADDGAVIIRVPL